MKSIKIDIPKGYVIDKENSTFEEIKFKPIQDFEYIDLGLPSGTLWANMNLGAYSVEDYGAYFSYDEISLYIDDSKVPKRWQFAELIDECEWKWINELKGYKVIGKNGKSIFLPASGFRNCDDGVYFVGSCGNYWSSTPTGSESAWGLDFDSDAVYMDDDSRCGGRSIRFCKSKN